MSSAAQFLVGGFIVLTASAFVAGWILGALRERVRFFSEARARSRRQRAREIREGKRDPRDAWADWTEENEL